MNETPVSGDRRTRRISLHHAFRAVKARHAAQRTRMERVAEQLTQIASSTWFFWLHVLWFALWIGWNAGVAVGAFDPFRRKDALAYAQEQHRKGVTGFKFYPPSGYRPGANEIPDITFSNTKPKHWEGRYADLKADDLNTLNDEFFAWCASGGWSPVAL